MKKITLWLLILSLLLPIAALADTSGDWQYVLNDDGRAVVTRYLGSSATPNLPWNLGGHIVIEIGEEAFAGNTRLRTVTLPAGITCIRMNAFLGCTALEEITLPARLETIEDGAFADCIALSVVELPDTVMELGENVFAAGTALAGSASSLAPDYAAACGLQYLGGDDKAEPNPAEELYHYEIINGYARITSYIGDEYEVAIPAELGGYPVRVIGTNAFSSRYGVERVVLPEGVTELERTSFRKCPGLTYIELPSTLLYIRDNAFYQCENLEEITIPHSVMELGDRAFTGCTQLKRVTIHAELQSMRTYTFYNCHSTLTIYAPQGSVAERHARSRGYRFVAIEE